MSTEPEFLETWNAEVLIQTATSETRQPPKLQIAVRRKTPSSSWSLIIGAKKSVFCLATSRNHADRIIHRLKTAGFPSNDLSAMFPNLETSEISAHEKSTSKHRREQPPVLARTAWWAARRVGFATIAALAIPDAGSFTVVGPLIAALNGRNVGGIARRLNGIGIPESEAKRYEGKIKESHILISVHTEKSEEIGRAQEIFMETGAQDICTTGESSPKDNTGIEYASRPTEAAYSSTRP